MDDYTNRGVISSAPSGTGHSYVMGTTVKQEVEDRGYDIAVKSLGKSEMFSQMDNSQKVNMPTAVKTEVIDLEYDRGNWVGSSVQDTCCDEFTYHDNSTPTLSTVARNACVNAVDKFVSEHSISHAPVKKEMTDCDYLQSQTEAYVDPCCLSESFKSATKYQSSTETEDFSSDKNIVTQDEITHVQKDFARSVLGEMRQHPNSGTADLEMEREEDTHCFVSQKYGEDDEAKDSNASRRRKTLFPPQKRCKKLKKSQSVPDKLYPYTVCPTSFVGGKESKGHTLSHKKRCRRYTDLLADIRYKSSLAKKDLFQCRHCRKSFMFAADLLSHLKYHEEVRLYQSVTANKKTQTGHGRTILTRKTKAKSCKATRKDAHTCSVCGSVFSSVLTLKQHMENPNRPFLDRVDKLQLAKSGKTTSGHVEKKQHWLLVLSQHQAGNGSENTSTNCHAEVECQESNAAVERRNGLSSPNDSQATRKSRRECSGAKRADQRPLNAGSKRIDKQKEGMMDKPGKYTVLLQQAREHSLETSPGTVDSEGVTWQSDQTPSASFTFAASVNTGTAPNGKGPYQLRKRKNTLNSPKHYQNQVISDEKVLQRESCDWEWDNAPDDNPAATRGPCFSDMTLNRNTGEHKHYCAETKVASRPNANPDRLPQLQSCASETSVACGPRPIEKPFLCKHCCQHFATAEEHDEHREACHADTVSLDAVAGPLPPHVSGLLANTEALPCRSGAVSDRTCIPCLQMDICNGRNAPLPYRSDANAACKFDDIHKTMADTDACTHTITMESLTALPDRPQVHRMCTCRYCDSVFDTPQGLSAHQRVHIKGRPHECNACTERFLTSLDLRQHKLTQHADSVPYLCPQCNATFPTSKGVNIHLAKHERDRSARRQTPKGIATIHKSVAVPAKGSLSLRPQITLSSKVSHHHGSAAKPSGDIKNSATQECAPISRMMLSLGEPCHIQGKPIPKTVPDIRNICHKPSSDMISNAPQPPCMKIYTPDLVGKPRIIGNDRFQSAEIAVFAVSSDPKGRRVYIKDAAMHTKKDQARRHNARSKKSSQQLSSLPRSDDNRGGLTNTEQTDECVSGCLSKNNAPCPLGTKFMPNDYTELTHAASDHPGDKRHRDLNVRFVDTEPMCVVCKASIPDKGYVDDHSSGQDLCSRHLTCCSSSLCTTGQDVLNNPTETPVDGSGNRSGKRVKKNSNKDLRFFSPTDSYKGIVDYCNVFPRLSGSGSLANRRFAMDWTRSQKKAPSHMCHLCGKMLPSARSLWRHRITHISNKK